MKKILKPFGNSHHITFDKEDMKIYELKAYDVLDIEICKIGKVNKKGGKHEIRTA